MLYSACFTHTCPNKTFFQRQALTLHGMNLELFSLKMVRELIYWFIPISSFFGMMVIMVLHPQSPGGFIFLAGAMIHPIPATFFAYLFRGLNILKKKSCYCFCYNDYKTWTSNQYVCICCSSIDKGKLRGKIITIINYLTIFFRTINAHIWSRIAYYRLAICTLFRNFFFCISLPTPLLHTVE